MDMTRLVNPRSFGAVGDGVTKDTAAIQAAIDHAAHSGGGCVRLSPGVYVSGTLMLKSHVDLHLMAGATLLGSPDRADYNPDDRFPESPDYPRENVSGAHLVVAYRVDNVSITGHGTIDGNASVFMGGLTGTDDMPYRYKVRPVDRSSFPWRPGQMVWFCRCTNISLHDVTLTNTTYWSCLLLGCEDVRVRGLRIVNPPTTINGDGLDIDCCRNVTVSDCVIRSGDDCLTLRGNAALLGEDATPCENVVVTNCVLSSPCCGIRVGVGDGIVRRCRLSNIIITDSRTGICMVSRWNDLSAHGTQIEDIRFADFTLDCSKPFHLLNGHMAPALPPAGISNISFDRFNIRATGSSELCGDPGLPLRKVSFRDIQWQLAWDEQTSCRHPCMLRAVHVDDSRFENILIEHDTDARAVTEGIVLDQCHGVTLRRLEPNVSNDIRFKPLRCRDCEDIQDWTKT